MAVFGSTPSSTHHASDHVIDPSNPSEVHYWIRFFGCTEAALQEALTQVGTEWEQVWRYLASPEKADL